MVIMQNSEYRRHFVPKFDTFKPEYSANVGYRSARRSAECAHNHDVFTWEPEPWAKKSDTSVVQEEPRPGVNPSVQYKHAVFKRNYDEKMLTKCIEEQCDLNGPAEQNKKSEEPKTPPPSPQDETNEENAKNPATTKPKQQKTAVKSNTSKKRPKKPTQNAPAVVSKKTTVRPKSCQADPATARAVTLKPPFVNFGCKDTEPQMSVKKTYNVKSPTDVHASAILALKWREEQHSKRVKSAPSGGKKRTGPKVFDVLMDKETSCWQTEYGGHYQRYKPAEYERNANSRMSVRRCTEL